MGGCQVDVFWGDVWVCTIVIVVITATNLVWPIIE